MRLKIMSLVALTAILAAAGCASDTSPGGATGAAETPATEQEQQVAETPQVDPASCLHGTWLIDNSFFLKQFKELGANEASEVTGKVTQTFEASGDVTTVYDSWQISMPVEGVETVISRDGTDKGKFSVDGSTLSVQETDLSSAIVLTISGIEQRFEVNSTDFIEAPYTCEADSASIAAPDGTANLTRIK